MYTMGTVKTAIPVYGEENRLSREYPKRHGPLFSADLDELSYIFMYTMGTIICLPFLPLKS